MAVLINACEEMLEMNSQKIVEQVIEQAHSRGVSFEKLLETVDVLVNSLFV